jgi:hypothetical protein
MGFNVQKKYIASIFMVEDGGFMFFLNVGTYVEV